MNSQVYSKRENGVAGKTSALISAISVCFLFSDVSYDEGSYG